MLQWQLSQNTQQPYVDLREVFPSSWQCVCKTVALANLGNDWVVKHTWVPFDVTKKNSSGSYSVPSSLLPLQWVWLWLTISIKPQSMSMNADTSCERTQIDSGGNIFRQITPDFSERCVLPVIHWCITTGRIVTIRLHLWMTELSCHVQTAYSMTGYKVITAALNLEHD